MMKNPVAGVRKRAPVSGKLQKTDFRGGGNLFAGMQVEESRLIL